MILSRTNDLWEDFLFHLPRTWPVTQSTESVLDLFCWQHTAIHPFFYGSWWCCTVLSYCTHACIFILYSSLLTAPTPKYNVYPSAGTCLPILLYTKPYSPGHQAINFLIACTVRLSSTPGSFLRFVGIIASALLRMFVDVHETSCLLFCYTVCC